MFEELGGTGHGTDGPCSFEWSIVTLENLVLRAPLFDDIYALKAVPFGLHEVFERPTQ
jgi:hypothetical protein